jgi:hypothetical protein
MAPALPLSTVTAKVLCPKLCRGLHGVAEEVFGEALPAVIGMSEKFGDESSFRFVASEGAICGDDGGSDASVCVSVNREA